jgi:small redox-active disulfide protein 2
MTIKILGTGCPKCRKLEANARKAVEQAGMPAQIEKVTGVNDIMKYNVMMTPALVIDEQVKATGKVLTPEQISKLLGS